MKALILNALGRGFDVENVEIATPTGREVLVDVQASGLCHTDLLFATHDIVPTPAVLGHEVAGIVAAVGPDVSQVHVGDHVVGSLAQACGACARCLSGRPFQCQHPEATLRPSRRGIWDTNKTLWGSFLIDSPEGRIYFAGDSAYGAYFRTVYEKFGAPRVSLLPIGAYEPRWFMSRMHMNPDEAVRAHLDLHSQSSIGMHFGVIDNAGESYDAPVDDLIAARRAHGVDATNFVAPHYGQVFRY